MTRYCRLNQSQHRNASSGLGLGASSQRTLTRKIVPAGLLVKQLAVWTSARVPPSSRMEFTHDQIDPWVSLPPMIAHESGPLRRHDVQVRTTERRSLKGCKMLASIARQSRLQYHKRRLPVGAAMQSCRRSRPNLGTGGSNWQQDSADA